MTQSQDSTQVCGENTSVGELLHICRRHPFASDPSCGDDCISFCGQGWEGDRETLIECGATPAELCIVCDSLSGRGWA